MKISALSDEEKSRFWSSVDRRGANECWPWTLARKKKGGGYGVFNTRVGQLLAHRAAFVLSGGTFADGELVLHSCDNPPCCNPSHLRAGTSADNGRDKAVRGRSRSVLTGQKVLEIRALRASGVPFKEIAERFGVAEITAQQAARGRRAWKHLP